MNLELKDMASTAGATVGLVIATSIFLQLLTTKYIAIYDKYRVLTGEYRAGNPADPRRASLREQIAIYHKRCHRIRRASSWLIYGEFSFLGTILFACLTIVFPQVGFIKVAGACTMMVGLIAVGVGAAYELSENEISNLEVESELSDLPDLEKPDPAHCE